METKNFAICLAFALAATHLATPKILWAFPDCKQAEAREVQSLRDARESLNRGIKAYTEQKFEEAARFIQHAIELDPAFETARVYLATIYTTQFVPASTDPKNVEMANKAIDTFEQLLDNAKNPSSQNCMNAMLSIAVLYSQLKRYPESRTWCNNLLKINPQSAEAYYRIAVIDFNESFEKTGVQGEKVNDCDRKDDD